MMVESEESDTFIIFDYDKKSYPMDECMNRLLYAFLLISALLFSQYSFAVQTLIDNVNGYTLDSQGKLIRFEAMLIDDGKVMAIGSHAGIAGRAKQAKVIDGKNRTLLPGLIDAHGHVMNLGANILQANLVGTQSLDAALVKVKNYAAAHPTNPWIIGRGWNQVI